MQTFVVGAPADDVALSLSLLDRAAEALHTCVVDDVHVGARFASQLATTTNLVRKTIIRVAANGAPAGAGLGSAATQSGTATAQPSRGTSRSPVSRESERDESATTTQPLQGISSSASWNHSVTRLTDQLQGSSQSVNSNPRPQDHAQATSSSANPPYSQSQSHAQHNIQPSRHLQTYATTDPALYAAVPQPQDPLYGIEAQFYDPNNPAFTLMPPDGLWLSNGSNPTPSAETLSDNFAGEAASGTDLAEFGFGGSLGMDWFALPMDRLLTFGGKDVTATSYGPDIGGQDMLDVLLSGEGGMGDGFGGLGFTAGSMARGY